MEAPLLPHFTWTPESRQPCPYVPTNGLRGTGGLLSVPASKLPPIPLPWSKLWPRARGGLGTPVQLLKCAPGGRTLANPAPAWMPGLSKAVALHLQYGAWAAAGCKVGTHRVTSPSRASLPIPTQHPMACCGRGSSFLMAIEQGRHLGC